MQLLGKLFGLVSGPPVNEVSAEELKNRLSQKNKPLLVDMRSAAEYKAGHISGAIHIAAHDIPQQLNKLSKDKDIVFQCWHGNTSRQAIATLLNKGYSQERLTSLQGGMSGWVSAFGQKGLVK
jgi:rhodanese-related sulfurtransferase